MIRLFAHQSEQLAFFRERPRALSILPYGAGKTLPTILRLADLSPPRRALVVTTTSTLTKWIRDLQRFGQPIWRITLLHGTAAQRLRALQVRHGVAVVNYEGVRVLGDKLRKLYSVFVFDEIHRLRRPSSQISRGWASIARDADYVYGLTGSPLLENPLDLFGVFRTLNYQTFGTDFQHFLNAFCVPTEPARRADDSSQRWRLRPGALLELTATLHSYSFHRSYDQLDHRLPRMRVVEPIRCSLHPSVRRAYDQMQRKTTRIVSLRGQSPQTAGVHLERLAQATRGWLYESNRSVHRLGPNTVRDSFQTHLEAIRGTGPVVVWAVRKPDVEDAAAALAALGLEYEIVEGSTPLRRRDLTLRAFNSGDLDALVTHPRCLGEGVDIQAPYSVRYSYRWSAQEYTQSLGRLLRPTNAYPSVTHTDIVAADTIDESILQALRRKENLLDLVLSARHIPWTSYDSKGKKHHDRKRS